MSTKIYDGMRMTDYPSLAVLHARMAELRKKAHKVSRKLFVSAVANLATHYVDRHALGFKLFGDFEKESILSKASHDVEQRHRDVEKTSRRDPECDFSFTLEILPIKRGILLMPFTERSEFLNLLKRQEWIESYGFWDNTDPEEGVAEGDWDKREKDWDEALGYNIPGQDGIPAQNGFSVTLHPMFPYWPEFPSHAEILKCVPPFGKRLHNKTFGMAWDDIGKKAHKKALKKDPKADAFQSFLGVERMLSESEEGKLLQKKWQKIVISKIPHTITEAHLKQELPVKPKEIAIISKSTEEGW